MVHHIKPPRHLTAKDRQHNTNSWTLWTPTFHGDNNFDKYKRSKGHTIYAHYVLYMNPNLTSVNQIPFGAIKIDDYCLWMVLNNITNAKILFNRWNGDIDQKGMPRAERVPFGHAAKAWKSVGDVDVEGNVVGYGQDGYYCLWWRGIHCLMGKEGEDAGLYQIRPSWEEFKCDGFGFKIAYKAVVQLPAGHPI